MKYRFTKSCREATAHKSHAYTLRGHHTLKRMTHEKIRLWDLFGGRALPPGRKQKKYRLRLWIRTVSDKLRQKIRQVATKKTLSRLTGALFGSLAVTILLGGLLAWMLFGRYTRPSISVTVPDFCNQSIQTLLAEKEERISFSISYQYNEGYAPGTVISQSPSPGVTRRLYGKEDRLTVTLTVCRDQELYTLPHFAEMSRRDACLALRLAGMKIHLIEEHSDAVPPDTVLRSEPSPGEHLPQGDTVTLFISRGKDPATVSVPDLYLLSESAARTAVEQAGLAVGSVTYVPSELPIGCVISQTVTAGTTLPQNSSISFCVSLGRATTVKVVPSLFGLTVEEAKNALRAVGLTVGSIQYAPHAAPAGTVIAQSVPPDTPITSALTSVSLTVSQ